MRHGPHREKGKKERDARGAQAGLSVTSWSVTELLSTTKNRYGTRRAPFVCTFVYDVAVGALTWMERGVIRGTLVGQGVHPYTYRSEKTGLFVFSDLCCRDLPGVQRSWVFTHWCQTRGNSFGWTVFQDRKPLVSVRSDWRLGWVCGNCVSEGMWLPKERWFSGSFFTSWLRGGYPAPFLDCQKGRKEGNELLGKEIVGVVQMWWRSRSPHPASLFNGQWIWAPLSAVDGEDHQARTWGPSMAASYLRILSLKQHFCDSQDQPKWRLMKLFGWQCSPRCCWSGDYSLYMSGCHPWRHGHFCPPMSLWLLSCSYSLSAFSLGNVKVTIVQGKESNPRQVSTNQSALTSSPIEKVLKWRLMAGKSLTKSTSPL